MIGKLVKGNSHSGALRYDNEKEGAEFIETNCSSDNWQQIGAEMKTVSESNKRCEKNCIHISMSAPEGERLTNEQWSQANAITMRELKLEGHQYSMTRHTDGEHDHVHVTINRINHEGKAWNDSRDFERTHAAMRVVEKEMWLERMEDHQITKDGRFEQTKTDLDESVKAARGKGLEGLKTKMKDRGYTINVNKSKTTGKISGISIKSDSDGKSWKASELRKGGYRGMEKDLNNAPTKDQKQSFNGGNSSGKALASGVSKGMSKMGNLSPVKMPKMLPKLSSIPTSGGAILKQLISAANQSVKKHRELER